MAKFSCFFCAINGPELFRSDTREYHQFISSNEITVGEFNAALQKTTYIPEAYDGRKLEDVVTLEVVGDIHFRIQFPVTIERTKMPVLTQRKSSAIKDRVTVITKTYLRYPCVDRLIKSIAVFYPGITVIVADDNPTDHFEEINNPLVTVKQYKMPAREGWFAGRALAQSQVRTQFYLWVDDDFIFSEETNLEYMVAVAENTGYDIIGGALNGHVMGGWAKNDFLDLQKSPDGYCFDRKKYSSFNLPGYENECQVVDIIENFFLARTTTVGKIRFDPEFERKGHREFFIDAIGELRIAWCSRPSILHRSDCVLKDNEKQYTDDRYGKSEGEGFADKLAELWYHRNHIKCSNDIF